MGDPVGGKKFKDAVMGQARDGPDGCDGASDFDMKKLNGKKEGTSDNVLKEVLSHKDEKRDKPKEKKYKNHISSGKIGILKNNSDVEKQSKQKRGEKSDKPQKRKGPLQEEDDANVKRELQKKSKTKRGELDVIDDAEASFVELFTANHTEDPENGREKKVNKIVGKSAGGIVTFPGKRKKAKAQCSGSILDFSPAVEVGMGGASTWGDE